MIHKFEDTHRSQKGLAGSVLKKLIVRIPFIVLFALALCAPKPMHGQAAPFKLGDSVEVQYAGQWVTGVVTKDLESGTYVVNHGSQIMYINQGPANIRAHQMTPAEKAAADQSAQAFASRPTGNGVGAQYGAREPATCKSRSAPPNAATARQYMLCDMEGVDGFGNLLLYTDVTVQIAAPRALSTTRIPAGRRSMCERPYTTSVERSRGTNAASRFWAGAPIRQHITATCTTSHRPPGPASAIPSVTGIA